MEWHLLGCANGGAVLVRGDLREHPQSHLQILPIEEARLIVASQDLLAALKDAVDSLEYIDRIDPEFHGWGVRLDRIKAAKAAIAKAEGR